VKPPTTEDLDEAFWQACHGGERRTAEYLHSRGAGINAHHVADAIAAVSDGV
jgi:hypothetical protein